jgi:hypothetical protein
LLHLHKNVWTLQLWLTLVNVDWIIVANFGTPCLCTGRDNSISIRNIMWLKSIQPGFVTDFNSEGGYIETEIKYMQTANQSCQNTHSVGSGLICIWKLYYWPNVFREKYVSVCVCVCVCVMVVIYQGNETLRNSCHLTISSILCYMSSPKVTCQHYSLDMTPCSFVTRAQRLLSSAELETLSVSISYNIDGS